MPDVPGVTHRFVTARGARFHVAAAGSSNGGEPAVLLHGLPLHWYAWRKIIQRLAGRYRLYCVDLRGCGWSEAAGPASGYRTGELARDVLAVLDALGLAGQPVNLIGHAEGGWVGFELCLMAPERFSRFVAVNAAHPRPSRPALVRHAWRFWYTAFWEYPVAGRAVLRRWPRFTRARLRQWAGRGHRWDEAALDEFTAASRTRQAAGAIQAMLWQFVLHDIPSLVLGRGTAELTVPTLLLGGEHDPVSRPAPAKARTGNLRVVVMPGAHLLPETAPDLVAAAASEHFG
jgi:pimeloyl-ACP methyl ester carboxylesterase